MKWLACVLWITFGLAPLIAAPPNVLLVITDDQGYGDLGLHGNPIVQTPLLDAFAKANLQFQHFYVSPVCSPTRSSLLTGLYNFRTGVVDTYLGRSLMRPGEFPTLAELLKKAGYRTGLFGKWHLGDNYPLRPEDRGFDQTLWHRGGGLGQPSDVPGGGSYFNPILVKNGQEIRTPGYCTDVFTDAAIAFFKDRSNQNQPFFAYVAYNCPHSPYEVPEDLAAKYRRQNLNPDAFPKIGQPWATKKLNTEEIARAYGMIENIDSNFGRMLQALNELKLREHTLIIFLTDNGPGGVRFNSGLRGRKASVYEGGIKVPCFVSWPSRWKQPRSIPQPAAHIDWTPTILQACGVKTDSSFDGRSLMPILDDAQASWPDRNLMFQWHRGDEPQAGRAYAVRGPRYKLVQAAGIQPGDQWTPKVELFDLSSDPYEQKDLVAAKPDTVQELQAVYASWFQDVTKKGFQPPRIHVGTKFEPMTRLSRQDWRGPQANWTPESRGYWELQAEAGEYVAVVHAAKPSREFKLVLDQRELEVTLPEMQTRAEFRFQLPSGPVRLQADVMNGLQRVGAERVELQRK